MKVIKQFCFFVIGIFAVAISGCYYDNEEELYPNAPECVTDSLTYNAHMKTIIDTRCAISGCHVSGGTGNGIFTNYAGIKAKVDNGSLHERVVVRKDMPPAGSTQLNECQIQQFDTWIAGGAPEN